MGLANYKSRPKEAVRLGIAACTAAGITVDVDSRLRALCCRYRSGGATPDYDAADAFFKGSEGAIWVPRIACRSGLVPLYGRSSDRMGGHVRWISP
jgi:hypothetical protein